MRLEAGLSQDQLAAKCATAQSHIAKIETWSNRSRDGHYRHASQNLWAKPADRVFAAIRSLRAKESRLDERGQIPCCAVLRRCARRGRKQADPCRLLRYRFAFEHVPNCSNRNWLYMLEAYTQAERPFQKLILRLRQNDEQVIGELEFPSEAIGAEAESNSSKHRWQIIQAVMFASPLLVQTLDFCDSTQKRRTGR